MRPTLFALFVFAMTTFADEPSPFGPGAWKGGTPDEAVRNVWPQSVCWRHAQSTRLDRPFGAPQNWSRFGAISFWLHSEKATGSSFVVFFPSENPKSQGDDYYSWRITLDWMGWKQFVLPLNELGATREPIGWHHIQSVSFIAHGYGNKPDPTAVVRLDGVELLATVGTRQWMTDAELFVSLDLDLPALSAVKKSVKAGHIAAAKAALAKYLHQRTTPHWLFDWRQPAFRDPKNRARSVAAADKVLQHKFDYPKGPGQKGTLDFGAKIDWTANPTEGEARTHLWNESINRHFHFRTLADAYWETGQDKYAKEIADEILDWTASNPAPLLASGNGMPNGCKAWQTLTTGIRLADTWPHALYRCLGSPAFSDDAICAMFKSVYEQARHLVRWPTVGNWLTAEANGLYSAGALFLEFRQARDWRRIALERLYKQLDDEVYPDGMEYELAAGYNCWVVRQFSDILELADLNGLRGEVPADFLAKMEKMFNYLLYASMTNGQIPGLNDANNTDIRKELATGFKLFPQRQDFQFVATGGKSGHAPAETSHAFPYVGHYVMRSGWDKDATYLLFDAGPFGFGHQHEDKLHFVLWSHGRQLVLDPGNFLYDNSRWRRYVLSTAGHNTIMVDGQNQNRHGRKETYFWPRPWTTVGSDSKQTVGRDSVEPAVPHSVCARDGSTESRPTGKTFAPPDTRWFSTPEADCAVGSYADGYGPGNAIAVTHQRRIVFVKPEKIFIVMDTLTPRDDREHRYEALFHLDAANATVDEPTKAVRTDNADTTLAIVPLAGDGLAVQFVKGKEDAPVQGWAQQPWRAIPTAIYEKAGKGVVTFLFVLAPSAKGAPPSVNRVEKVSGDATSLAARIAFADGRSLEVSQSGVEITLVRKKADGQQDRVTRIGAAQ
ncbi:MAG: heparinase II/III family protein [Verrucomicrobia bacterium]|nr:heparinase II/III family protein [Verrucomicrobiota bacterium]